MRTVSRKVSAGLGQIFSVSGFWGTVGSGALTGAGAGGVTSLITGQNFLEGVIKGAVIGGAVAVITNLISSTFQYFLNKKPTLITLDDLKNKGYDLTATGEDYTSTSQVRSDFDNLVGDYEISTSNINNEMKGAFAVQKNCR